MKHNKTTKGCLLAIAVAFVIVILFALLIPRSGENTEQSKDVPAVTSDSILAERDIEKMQTIIDALKKDNAVDVSNAKSVDELIVELSFFDMWANLVQKNEVRTNEKCVKLSAELKKQAALCQKKAFPKIRKKYVDIVSAKGWENDLYIKSSGERSATITYTCVIFAANKNIAEFQKTIQPTLERFRFKKSQYMWYEDAEKYTYYNMQPLSDDAVY